MICWTRLSLRSVKVKHNNDIKNNNKFNFILFLGMKTIGLDPLPIPDIKIPYNLDKVQFCVHFNE